MQTLSDSEKQEIRSLLETCEGLADELQRKNPFDCARDGQRVRDLMTLVKKAYNVK